MRLSNWLQGALRDIRYGMRTLAKNPLFTIISVLALGLGIGVNTAIFSIVNCVLLRQLPVRDPQQLVVIAGNAKGSSQFSDFSYPDFLDYRSQSGAAFSDMLGYLPRSSGFVADGKPEQVFATYVSYNFFSMLGIRPYIGRVVEPEDGESTTSSNPVAVLSYSYWQRRFNGDLSVIGKSAFLDGNLVTIIGVTPKGFHGAFAFMDADLFTPMTQMILVEKCGCAVVRGPGNMRALGRLRPGVDLSQARAVLQLISTRLSEQYPNTNKGISYEVFPEPLARPQADAAAVWPLVLSIAMALAIVVLVLACANVATLLLARANVRQTEMAVRLTLGAGRTRLVRQLIIENLLLTLVGGVVGTLLGVGASRTLSAMSRPVDFPTFNLDLTFDWRVFLFGFALTAILGFVLGIIPARAVWRSNLSLVLHEGSQTATRGRKASLAGNILVAVQLAASTILLSATGTFIHSLRNAERTNLGFDSHNVLNFSLDVSQAGFDEQKGREFYAKLLDGVRELPGVKSVAYASGVPFASGFKHSQTHLDGQTFLPGESAPVSFYNEVSPDYFKVMKIAVLQGRSFTDADDARASRVAIVNKIMAERFWPGQNPIGKRFRRTAIDTSWLEVVGIAADAKYISPTPGFRSYYYVPILQHYQASRTLQLRTNLPPDALARLVLGKIQGLEPNLPVGLVLTMDQQLQGINGFYLFHINANSSAVLGCLGLVMAVIGVYGVVSHATSRRIREVGVRLALGAAPSEILKMFLSQGLRLVLIGVGSGMVLSLILEVVVTPLLPFVGAIDVLSLGVTLVLLTGTALLASYFPARRMTYTDPIAALRHE
jgi:putative ABC transport system permease protein